VDPVIACAIETGRAVPGAPSGGAIALLAIAKNAFERLLEAVVIVLMTGLAVVVLLGIVYRSAGAALVWYDEVASIMLAWLTYYGAALAALKRAHIGVPEIVRMMPRAWRAITFVVAEGLVFAFFLAVAWIGWHVLDVLQGSTLASLPRVPETLAQSPVMVGAVLFILAEALSLPGAWRKTIYGAGGGPDAARTGAAGMAATE